MSRLLRHLAPVNRSGNELATRDPGRARAFYGELFGRGSDELVDG